MTIRRMNGPKMFSRHLNTSTCCFLTSTKHANSPEQTTLDSAAAFLSTMVPLVVVKRGPNGAIARRGNEVFSAPGQRGEFVDAVGAGDSFDAGFIHQFIRGAPMKNA